LRLAQGNPQMFSKPALARRKQGPAAVPPAWLNDYVKRAYVPKAADFRHLRRYVNNHRNIYIDKLSAIAPPGSWCRNGQSGSTLGESFEVCDRSQQFCGDGQARRRASQDPFRQIGEYAEIDRILMECSLVLFEAEAP
jgi:hypothetical protein